MDEKIAHLGFIQDVINRMGSNSFMIKGWCVALALHCLLIKPIQALLIWLSSLWLSSGG